MTGTAAAGALGILAGYFLRTTVILALALAAAAAAKRRPAAFRHFILSSTLIGLLLVPLLTWVPVGWRSPLLPAWMAAPLPHATGDPAAKSPGNGAEVSLAAGLGTDADRDARQEGAGLVVRYQAPDGGELRPGEISPARSSSGRNADQHGHGSASQAFTSQARLKILNMLVAVLWSAGLAALILRLLIGLTGAVRLTAEGTALEDPAWRMLLARFLALVSLRRKVRLKSHPEVLVPLTWGWRKPVVLLPDGADTWTDDERSSALYHELSHIKRADFLVMLLVRTSLAFFWWNPLCWVVYHRLLKEQELACDELVLRAGIRPSTYAASLLAFRRLAGFRWNPSAALLGMLGRSSFQERLAAILKQKLTSMEVKMKTKIMLAMALVLAVALIGTARPAVGVEKDAAAKATVLAASTAPAAFEIVTPAPAAQETQTEKAVAQEKEKEKAKAAEKKILITTKEGGKAPIEITITEGDTVKMLVLDKSLTITKGKDGDVLILTPEGKEPLVLKGEPLRLEIKGGGLEVIKEGQVVKSGDKSDYITYSFTPRAHAEAEGKTFRVVEPGEGEKRGVKVVVETHKAGEAGPAWTIEEPEKGEGGKAFAFSSAKDKEMLAKVQALQEQVQAIKAKKMDIGALEESLKKLEAELKANEEKLRTLEYTFDREPDEITVVKKIRQGEPEGKVNVWVAEKDAEKDLGKDIETAEAKAHVKVMSKNEGAMTIVIGEKGLGREAYERALAKLKKELPEGYKIAESDFDEEDSSMTFKISVPEGKKTDEALVKKIVQSLKAEVDKK